MRRRRATTLVLLAAATSWAAWAAPLAAQESVFNLPGFGLPGSGESVRSRGIGGAGILPGTVFSLENPAPLARFVRAGLYLTLLGQRTRVDDGSRSGDFDDVDFPMGQAVVPAGDAAFAVGYYQFVDFDARLESSILFEGDTLPVTRDSEGGISVLSPTVAYAFDGRTGAGISLDVYIGSREEIRGVETFDLNENPVKTADSLSRSFNAVGATLGIEHLFGEGMRVGASYRFRPSISSEITQASAVGLVGRSAELDLPDDIALGAHARVTSRLTAAGALRYAGWGGFEGQDGTEGEFADAIEIGGGIEFAPETDVAHVLGPEAPARLGFRWRRLPVEVGGEPVREWAASLGYGRAFGARSRLDLVLEYGRRGTVDDNGLSERFLRLGVGVGVFEDWAWGGGSGP